MLSSNGASDHRQVAIPPDAAGYDVGVGVGRTTVTLGAASLSAAQDVRTNS